MSAYDKDANPDGLINLGIAENTLMTQEYLDYFKGAIKHLQPYDLTYGTQSSGSRRLNEAIAKMWNENFAPIEPVQPGQIVTGPGASSVLDQLIAALLDPGQGVLLAGPHYNGFDVNMVARSGAKIRPAPIPLEDVFTPRELNHLEEELQTAKEDGVEVRAVMLCSPHNPYGRTYDKETLLAYAQFCEKHDLHLISDEIYALSVFDNPSEYRCRVAAPAFLPCPKERMMLTARHPRRAAVHQHALPRHREGDGQALRQVQAAHRVLVQQGLRDQRVPPRRRHLAAQPLPAAVHDVVRVPDEG